MIVLLDTHIWLWMLADPERLGSLRETIEDTSVTLLLSAASSWEIAIKNSIGRLPLPEPVETYVPSRIRASGVEPISIDHTHVLGVSRLPYHHRDPFDRLLVAQAQLRGVPIASADPQLQAYDVEVLTPSG